MPAGAVSTIMTGLTLIRTAPYSGPNWFCANIRRKPPKGRLSQFKSALSSPEVIEDDMQIGRGSKRAAQVRIDDASARFDGRVVPKIVRGFQSHPGRIRGFVRRRPVRLGLAGNHTEAFGCGCAGQDGVHGQMFHSPFYISMHVMRSEAVRTGF